MLSPRTAAASPQPRRDNNKTTTDLYVDEPSTSYCISSKAPHVQVDAAAARGVSAGRT